MDLSATTANGEAAELIPSQRDGACTATSRRFAALRGSSPGSFPRESVLVRPHFAETGDAVPRPQKRDLIENAFNQLTSLVGGAGTTTFSYDGRGNQISKAEPAGTTTYSYDVRNRLTDIALPGGLENHFGYDSQGLRVYMNDSQGARSILLDGIEELAEYDTTGSARLARYDHDPSGTDLILTQRAGSDKYVTAADSLNSVYALLSPSGELVGIASYDVFGFRSAEGIHSRWGFAGRPESDDLTSYLRKRVLSVMSGSFLEPDPLGLELDPANVSEDLSLYSYVANRPADHTDPTGLMSFGFGFLVSATTWELLYLVYDGSLTIFTVDRYEKIVAGYASQECNPACHLTARRSMNTLVSSGGLLTYRLPTFIRHKLVGNADWIHWNAIRKQQISLLEMSASLRRWCRSLGFMAWAQYIAFMAALPVPLPDGPKSL